MTPALSLAHTGGFVRRKKKAAAASAPGGKKRSKYSKDYTEGWVEFRDKRVAKRVAASLHNTPMGARRRSPFRYDLWNLKVRGQACLPHLLSCLPSPGTAVTSCWPCPLLCSLQPWPVPPTSVFLFPFAVPAPLHLVPPQ